MAETASGGRWAIGVLVCLLLLGGGGGCGTKFIHYELKHEYAVADPQFARTVGNLLGPSIRHGNHVETLLNGDQIFPAMLDAIRHAERTVDLETYIYWSGAIGREFTDALIERARAGVRCNVLMDWLGSARIDHNYLKQMADAGVHVVEYHPVHIYDPSTLRQLDHRTHRKVMVVDGTIGFTGGVGIADEWRGNADRPGHWRDNHYRVTGPIVGELQGVFADNWMETTGEVLQGDDYFPALADAGGERAQVFKSSSNGGAESMELLFLLSLAAATKDVRIQSAYFVPGPAAIEAILAARKRGVRVQVLVPGGRIDEKIVRRASRATWGPLLRAGVEIAEYQPTMMHCKLMIVDDLWVSIGSSNFDNRSFRLNDEANLNVLDPTFAAGQIQVFEADRKKARTVTYEAWRHRPLKEKVMEGMAWLVSWEL